MLRWVFADTESGLPDTFALEANGAALDTLDYLVPTFQLVERDVAFFDAIVKINGNDVHSGNFKWRAGTLSHKIAEHIEDKEVTNVTMTNIKHSSVVTSEALSVLSKLKKPVTGFEKVEFLF